MLTQLWYAQFSGLGWFKARLAGINPKKLIPKKRKYGLLRAQVELFATQTSISQPTNINLMDPDLQTTLPRTRRMRCRNMYVPGLKKT